MKHCHGNWFNGTTKKSRFGFWLYHLLGSLTIFFLGMRFAIKRAPVSLLAFRLIKSLIKR